MGTIPPILFDVLDALDTWPIVLVAEDKPKGGIMQLLFGSQYSMLIMFGLIFFLFFLLVLQPERKRKAEFQAMLDRVKPNDRIVTIGGIFGTVVQVGKDRNELVIRVDEKNNTKIRIRKSAVAQVLADEDKREASSGDEAR